MWSTPRSTTSPNVRAKATCCWSSRFTRRKTTTPRWSSTSRICAVCAPLRSAAASAMISVPVRGLRGIVSSVIASRLLSELSLQDLAGGVAGQGVDEEHVLRHLEPGELTAAVLDELVGGHARVPLHRHECNGYFTPPVVGTTDDGGFEHGIVLVEDALDLRSCDVLATGNDHVLEPIDDVQVAVVVAPADVAGVEPPAFERGGRRVRVAPVSLEHLGAAEDDFAALARRQ